MFSRFKRGLKPKHCISLASDLMEQQLNVCQSVSEDCDLLHELTVLQPAGYRVIYVHSVFVSAASPYEIKRSFDELN